MTPQGPGAEAPRRGEEERQEIADIIERFAYYHSEYERLQTADAILAAGFTRSRSAPGWVACSDRLPLGPEETGAGSCLIRCSYGIQVAQYSNGEMRGDDWEFEWFVGPHEAPIAKSAVWAWRDMDDLYATAPTDHQCTHEGDEQ